MGSNFIMSIDKDAIEERKTAIQNDIRNVERTLTEYTEQQEQLRARLYALHGALQQCDNFLDTIEEE